MDGVLPSLVTKLLKQLGSFAAQQALQELLLLVGVDEEIENLQYNFQMVQAMLSKFEERRLRDEAVELWYDKLEDAYYMMDDVLDTWKTAMTRLQIQNEEEGEKAAHSNAPAPLEKKMKKVWSFFPSPSCCFRQVNNEVGHKIKKLNETLANILKGRFGIDLNSQPERVERLEITSIVDVSKIVGRNEYKDDPLNNLLGVGSQQESNPLVISLVGIGGIGKSTLAKLAYNHPKVIAHFDKIMWVSVSDPFNECNVAKALIRELDPRHEPLRNTDTTTILRIVCDLIEDKKFFLVFDDVWAKDIPKESEKWKPFKDALTHGAQGSRILVTTRNEEVAHMMGGTKTHIINLGNLTIDDCWLIIRKIAFFDAKIDQHKDLEPLGRQLAGKCHGLPLAAKLIGGYMCNKRTKEQWVKVLENSLWELEDYEKGLLGPLLLSYYELSLAEKKCFLFCAAFPKDHKMNRFELIMHWMAQGYIDIDSKQNMEMEDMAEKYLQNLAMHSFFQDFGENEIDDRIKSCKMHDIVHDFAQNMTKDVCFTIKGDEEVEKDFKRARQLSLMVEETFPESVYYAKNLRFFHLNFWSSKTIPPKLFDHLTCLRTLHLEGQSTLELPNEVEKLIHLRYLKLSCISLKDLPETVCNLCNLHSLDVRKCLKLEKLPQGMGKLINLRHLLLHDDGKIKSFPKGIGRLTCLRMLTYFPVAIGGEGDEICKLGELKNLSHLRFLCLKFDTIDEKTKLRRRMDDDVLVLNGLEPPPRLESLKIEFYMGTRLYPIWMMSLTTLKKLTLSQCLTLECLPPLGKLPLLESLVIASTENVRKVGDEFLGIELEPKNKTKNKKDDYDIVFPNLKFLKFLYLDNWEEWKEIGAAREEVENGTLRIMPHLQSLRINYCPKLKSLPGFICTTQIPSLYELVINEEPSLYEYGIGEEWDKISQIPNVKIGYRYVQRDGHEVKSLLGSLIDSKEFSHPKYQH